MRYMVIVNFKVILRLKFVYGRLGMMIIYILKLLFFIYIVKLGVDIEWKVWLIFNFLKMMDWMVFILLLLNLRNICIFRFLWRKEDNI